MDTIRMQLKTLEPAAESIHKTKTMMKNNLIALLDQTYPGVNAYLTALSVRTAARRVDLPRPFGMWTVCGTWSLTAFCQALPQVV